MDNGMEARVAVLANRLDVVDKVIESIPHTYATKQEVEMAVLQVAPSKDVIKEAMTEVLIEQVQSDKKDKRNWALELLKIVGTMIGTGGIIALIQAINSVPKG